MQVTLIVAGGAEKGRQIPVTAPEFIIGRDPHCQLRPEREDVSRRHCAIVQRGQRVWLRDLGSKNGTFLNHRELVAEETPIADGDEFEVGALRFRVSITSAPAPVGTPRGADGRCCDDNVLSAGQPGEQDASLDDTIVITRPLLAKPAPKKPMPDEIEKML